MSGEIADQVPLRGTSLVEAGAGTGKTHTIVSLYLRLLLERKLSVSQILVVTYTVAATAELRDRIRRRLVEEATAETAEIAIRCKDAIRDFDRAAIFSIHGFCQRALREHAFESGAGFESELVSDSRALLEEVAQDFWSRELFAAPRFQIDYARWAKLVPSRLAELAGRLASRPDAELRPPRPSQSRGQPDLSNRFAEWQRVYERAAKLWAACGSDVIELLAGAAERKELHGGSYRPKTIRGVWQLVMDELMGQGAPGLRRSFQYIHRLTRSGLKPNKGCAAPEHPFFELCEELVAADDRLDAALADWVAGVQHDFADYAKRELESRKRERDVLFFDDLLQRLRDALLPERGGETLARAIRRRHPVALIDEFQDTDPIQYEIFRRVWHELAEPAGPEAPSEEASALLLIGDPKQAIYAFRGADVFAYLGARADAGASVHGLVRNQRADPGLVAALNALFTSSSSPFARDEIPFEPALPREDASDALSGDRIATGLRFLLLEAPDPSKEISGGRAGGPLARAVAGEVGRILAGEHRIGDRALSPGDIAVLTRTNRQARAVQNALRELRIVSVLQSEESVFATNEARELERLMRALSEPENPARLRAALATPLLSSSADDLLVLTADESEAEWDVWTTRLGKGRQIWVEQGFLQAFRFLWVECGIAVRLLARIDGERRVTNLLHLGELLQRAALEERLGPQALLYWFGRRRAEAERTTSALAEDAQLRLESDAKAVQLLTIHRSKGLQYPVTICPFLWDGNLIGSNDPALRFHDPETGSLVFDASSPRVAESKELAKRETQEENLRVLYVALTRAKHHCSVVWGRFKGAETSPLAHFLHNPAFGPLKKRKDAQLRADLDAIAARAPGHISVQDWDTKPLPPLPREAPGAAAAPMPELVARQAKRRYSGSWRVSSFSGLIAGADAGAEEGRDYDSILPGEDVSDASPAAVALADFPAGPMPGILIHEIFERLDFGRAAVRGSDELEQLVARQLERRGFAARWQAPLVAALREVLAVPLLPGRPDSSLAGISGQDRLDEMEFVLPVMSPLTPGALARAFAAHALSPDVRRYAERAGALGFPTLSGHLRGFVDLVFRKGDRWSLVDYKSNRLGRAREDYAPASLAQAMAEHDYVLQYHLYLVALHRHLSLRLPGYDYDRHVEGAFYLFVRGMSSAHPPGWGIVHDLPPRALIEALSECLS